MSDLIKRIVIRLTERQDAWITEQAADEGMDNATFVRVLIDRLSKRRAPLIGMMQPTIAQENQRYYDFMKSDPLLQPAQAAEIIHEANDLLQRRMAEAEARLPNVGEWPEEQASAAIPLRRIGREVYNPRPK